MNKYQRFYVFDEHTDYVRACEKIGFFTTKQIGCFAEEFTRNGEPYKVLGRNECYSGWEINIVPDRDFGFDELALMAFNSHIYDERAVSIGLIIKNFCDDFIALLNVRFLNHKLKRNEKKLLNLIVKDISVKYCNVEKLQELTAICNIILKNGGT